MTMIRCPKCSHEQDNQLVCEACGLIFRKYQEAQERVRVLKETAVEVKPAGSPMMPRAALVIVLAVVAAAAIYYFTSGGKKEQPLSSVFPIVAGAPAGGNVIASGEGNTGQDPSREVKVVPGTPIDNARNATVSIEAPWGKGSGFFITENIIVTNKHVIAPDRSQLDEIRHKVETGRRLISLEQEKIEELREKANQMEEGPTRRQILIIIQEKERELARVLPMQEEAEARLKAAEQQGSMADIRIILADGGTLPVQSVQASPGRDIAILTVFPTKASVLRAASPNAVLRQGERVYTIGNPIGLRNTVTSGVFSGYRQIEGIKDVLLQTDAPINPGNSGGPLIDERGIVHGINTMIVLGTQGIGFAIPIQAVYEEFSITRQ
jgi:S1-C subfamily serine protease